MEGVRRYYSYEPLKKNSSFDTTRHRDQRYSRVGYNAVAFFINSERAFVQLHNALAYARTEHRQDSVQRYTKQLTRLVEATSYSAVIDKLKEDL